jgi:hypothetical protein
MADDWRQAIQVQRRETAVLSGKEGGLRSSRVRIWAISGERKWNGYKDRDRGPC